MNTFVGPNLTMAFPAFQVITDHRQPQGFWRIIEIPAPQNNFVPQHVQLAKVGTNSMMVLCP